MRPEMLGLVSSIAFSAIVAAGEAAGSNPYTFDLRFVPAGMAYFDHSNLGIGPSGEAQLAFFASRNVQLGFGALAYAPVHVESSFPDGALVALVGLEGVLRFDACEPDPRGRFDACPFFELAPVLAGGLTAKHEGGGGVFVNVRGGGEFVWWRSAGFAPFLNLSMGGLVAVSAGVAIVFRGADEP